MSRYKKLLNSIKDAKENKRKILLKNGIELDFRKDKWNDVFRNAVESNLISIKKKLSNCLVHCQVGQELL